jgi:WD40-like Beta Propeller Repeat
VTMRLNVCSICTNVADRLVGNFATFFTLAKDGTFATHKRIATGGKSNICTLPLTPYLSGAAFAGSADAFVLPAPMIFAPGVISGAGNDGTPTFLPDGRTLYFYRYGAAPASAVILESHRSGAGWSEPVVARFSGPTPDRQPAFSVATACARRSGRNTFSSPSARERRGNRRFGSATTATIGHPTTEMAMANQDQPGGVETRNQYLP